MNTDAPASAKAFAVARPMPLVPRLVGVLPEWRGLQGIVHLVFTTRRGLPPAVRTLIDHLAAGFPQDILAKVNGAR
jgi:DNA-binding transcriptional LysR family regulator